MKPLLLTPIILLTACAPRPHGPAPADYLMRLDAGDNGTFESEVRVTRSWENGFAFVVDGRPYELEWRRVR